MRALQRSSFFLKHVLVCAVYSCQSVVCQMIATPWRTMTMSYRAQVAPVCLHYPSWELGPARGAYPCCARMPACLAYKCIQMQQLSLFCLQATQHVTAPSAACRAIKRRCFLPPRATACWGLSPCHPTIFGSQCTPSRLTTTLNSALTHGHKVGVSTEELDSSASRAPHDRRVSCLGARACKHVWQLPFGRSPVHLGCDGGMMHTCCHPPRSDHALAPGPASGAVPRGRFVYRQLASGLMTTSWAESCACAMWAFHSSQHGDLTCGTGQELAGQCASVVAQQWGVVEGQGPPLQETLQALPASLSNLHSYLMFVAARIERLADAVAARREAFLAKRRLVRAPAALPAPGVPKGPLPKPAHHCTHQSSAGYWWFDQCLLIPKCCMCLLCGPTFCAS